MYRVVGKRGPADRVARAGKRQDMSVGDKLPVRVSDCRLGDGVIRERGEDRDAGDVAA